MLDNKIQLIKHRYCKVTIWNYKIKVEIIVHIKSNKNKKLFKNNKPKEFNICRMIIIKIKFIKHKINQETKIWEKAKQFKIWICLNFKK